MKDEGLSRRTFLSALLAGVAAASFGSEAEAAVHHRRRRHKPVHHHHHKPVHAPHHVAAHHAAPTSPSADAGTGAARGTGSEGAGSLASPLIRPIATPGGGGGGGGGAGWSDRRLKRAVRRIGRSPSGLPLYSFQYVWGGPRYEGVMAQDLLKLRPDAVIRDPSGYYKVDYSRLDVAMRKAA